MEKVKKSANKDTIYSAYEEALNKLKDLESIKNDPVKVIKEKERTETITTATNLIGLNILNPDIVNRYNKLEEAIRLKENQIKEIFDIETEAITLAALLQAQQSKTEEFEAEMAEKKAEFQKEISDLREQYKQEMAELKTQTAEYKVDLEKQRQREKEEYTYRLHRERAIEEDKWNDEKAVREKELAEREESIRVREVAANILDAKIVELEAGLDKVPNKIEVAVNIALEKAKKDADASKAIATNSIKKDMEHAVALKDLEIASLTEKYEAVLAERNDLRTKLDEAYVKMNNLASETVKSSGGVKILDSKNN